MDYAHGSIVTTQKRSWMRSLRRGISWGLYPAVMGLCVGLYFLLLNSGWSTFFASFAPVLLGAGAIAVFEQILPARRVWQPDQRTVRDDLVFLVFVQVALPKALTLLAAITLGHWLQVTGWTAGFWFHNWPVAMQAVLMILLADFSRYWLHVACHRLPPLWRLHSVHHSPQQLYWLNVGRFHPVEKSLQFLFDALPFLLLGVREEVIALYFVFYAVNGFFQHCNIDLKFGWLNYVISTAELHRWHHSRIPHESNSNFGNNIIIWDLLFGTWLLPRETEVETLGLMEKPAAPGGPSVETPPIASQIEYQTEPRVTCLR